MLWKDVLGPVLTKDPEIMSYMVEAFGTPEGFARVVNEPDFYAIGNARIGGPMDMKSATLTEEHMAEELKEEGVSIAELITTLFNTYNSIVTKYSANVDAIVEHITKVLDNYSSEYRYFVIDSLNAYLGDKSVVQAKMDVIDALKSFLNAGGDIQKLYLQLIKNLK